MKCAIFILELYIKEKERKLSPCALQCMRWVEFKFEGWKEIYIFQLWNPNCIRIRVTKILLKKSCLYVNINIGICAMNTEDRMWIPSWLFLLGS